MEEEVEVVEERGKNVEEGEERVEGVAEAAAWEVAPSDTTKVTGWGEGAEEAASVVLEDLEVRGRATPNPLAAESATEVAGAEVVERVRDKGRITTP